MQGNKNAVNIMIDFVVRNMQIKFRSIIYHQSCDEIMSNVRWGV